MKKKSSQKEHSKKLTESKRVALFLFEVGILSKTPRSGFHFLGTGDQTVAEHLNRTCFIGYMLALMQGTVDVGKVLQMCLFHDISETRISDLNYVHQKYVTRNEDQAHKDITDSIPFGEKMFTILNEYERRENLESVLAKDADNLEWILSLKEQVDIGNARARRWLVSALKRLKTSEAQSIAKEIMKTDSNDWWFGNKKVSVDYVNKKQ